MKSASQQPSDADDILTIGEVALRCRVSTHTVLQWVKKEGLPVYGRTAGGHRRFRVGDVDKFAAEKAAKAATRNMGRQKL